MQKIINQGELTVDFQLNSMVVQPTSLCNLNCTYCYLPNRNKNLTMPALTAYKIAEELAALDLEKTVNIIWHSGEPLTCGVKKFIELLEPFEQLRQQKKIRHSIQTNGSLINKEWCEMFLSYNFAVGVSIDGPRSLTSGRVDWRGNEAYDKIMAGIDFLKEAKVSFGVICVVTQQSISYAKELYNFFYELGCEAVGFSIVEEEGINKHLLFDKNEDTTHFWQEIFDAWLENPSVEVREFRRITVWFQSEIQDKQSRSIVKDMIPSIAYNGDVSLVSPEFLGIKPAYLYETFVVGNIHDSSFTHIINSGLNSAYIKDYVTGIEKCQEECEYFGFCRGGDASNKFFELGSLDVTETNHCKNSRKKLVDAVLQRTSVG